MSEKKIVIPGEYLGLRGDRKTGSNVYSEKDKVYSKKVGLLRESENSIDVVPLSGIYIPRKGDKIIGIIKEIQPSGWVVDINSPYQAFLPLAEGVNEFVDVFRTDLSKYYDIGDVVYLKILNIMKKKIIQLSIKDAGLRKLEGGILIKVTPTKIPRIIGRGGSMISMIKQKTKTNVIVGKNGIIWVKGRNADKVLKAIELIEVKSHLSGLTEKVSEFLDSYQQQKEERGEKNEEA